ncbi:MAG: M20 family metallopeptidase [Candidatus Lokiarchaeota archaeon]|nr:M20 family metallopeptidase [Candidatus Lokiarchaeota archaeon]
MGETEKKDKFESVIDLTQRLVRINSEAIQTEHEMERFLWNYLEELGFFLELVPYRHKRNNIIAIYPNFESYPIDRYIAFSGHMDTVPGYKENEGFVKEGKLYGRGSTDMKGGIAAILTAVKNFLTEHNQSQDKLLKRKKLKRGIVLFFTVDEETGCAGVISLTKKDTPLTQRINKDFFIDLGINGEPTSLSPIISHKGVVWFELDFYGKAAHASVPHLGKNAIEMAAEFIIELKKLHRILKSRNYLANSDITPPTMNIGIINGGSKTNVIPDHVHLEIDRRTIPGETVDSALEEIRSVMRKFPDEKIEVKMSHPGESYQIPQGKENELYKLVLQVCQKFGASNQSFMEGYTEADIYYRYFGIPIINLGPGGIEQAHTETEYVETKELLKACRIYYEILKQFCWK